MDRRSFLKFLSAAPLAAPMVAASAAASASSSAASFGVLGVSGIKTIGMRFDASDWYRLLNRNYISQFDRDALTFNLNYTQTFQVVDRVVRAAELPIHSVLERAVERALDLIPGASSETADPVAPVDSVAPPPASEGT